MSTNTTLLTAYTLAQAGHLAAAEELILSDPRLDRLPAALDLLARIRAEQGNISEARRLWNEILATDPENVKAAKALKSMDRRFTLSFERLLISGIAAAGILVVALGIYCTILKRDISRLSAKEPVMLVSDVEEETEPAEPLAVLREFTSSSPSVEAEETEPGNIRVIISRLPNTGDLKALAEIAANLNALESVSVASTFFANRAASREVLTELLCDTLAVSPTRLYIAAAAETAEEALIINLREGKTPRPVTPIPPAIGEVDGFLVEPHESDEE